MCCCNTGSRPRRSGHGPGRTATRSPTAAGSRRRWWTPSRPPTDPDDSTREGRSFRSAPPSLFLNCWPLLLVAAASTRTVPRGRDQAAVSCGSVWSRSARTAAATRCTVSARQPGAGRCRRGSSRPRTPSSPAACRCSSVRPAEPGGVVIMTGWSLAAFDRLPSVRCRRHTWSRRNSAGHVQRHGVLDAECIQVKGGIPFAAPAGRTGRRPGHRRVGRGARRRAPAPVRQRSGHPQGCRCCRCCRSSWPPPRWPR